MARSAATAAELVKRLLNNSGGVTGQNVCTLATRSSANVIIKTTDGDTITCAVTVS